MRRKQLVVWLVFGMLVTAFGVATGGVDSTIQKEFRGQILITQHALRLDRDNVKATRKACKVEPIAKLKHEMIDGVATWTFHYTAFMKKKPGVKSLSLDFYTTDKDKLYIANKRMTGIDPTLKTLQGRIQITEDDGPLPGRTYKLKLTGEIRGKDVVFATTTLKML